MSSAELVDIAKSLEATKALLINRLKEDAACESDDPLALLRRLRVLQSRVQDLGPLIKQNDAARKQLIESVVQARGHGKETQMALPQAARLTQDADRKLDDIGALLCLACMR